MRNFSNKWASVFALTCATAIGYPAATVLADEASELKACHEMIIDLEQPAVEAQLPTADFQSIVVLIETGRVACDAGDMESAKSIANNVRRKIIEIKNG